MQWTTKMPEPANGRYVIVGEDPCEIVAARTDGIGDHVGQWFPLVGSRTQPMTFEDILRPGGEAQAQPVNVRVLYEARHAIEDLVIPAAVLAYQRDSMTAQAAAGGLAMQYAQRAMAVRGFVEDLASRYGLPDPQWGDAPHVPPGTGSSPTAPAGATQDLAASQRTDTNSRDGAALTNVASGGVDERARRRFNWRNWIPSWFLEEPERPGRHRQERTEDTQSERGDSGAFPAGVSG